ncbi:MAG: methionine--tRNA ligase [Gammaproteobacteria bacterium]|nr:methionine--tRNA ligase [Gammaproteobacteria bacterium]
MRRILVTSGLPYANGSIHLGHLVEYIQTDIWARVQRLTGNECYYVCGDDAHGTPIMLSAENQKITPEELINKVYNEHKADLLGFNIYFDNYHTTHSEENRKLANLIFKRLEENGDIEAHTILQAYDEKQQMFLPDRYVRGECPNCGAKDQYGDSCEVCSSTYSPMDLKNPISTVSGSKPITKESEHLFFRLDKYAKVLQKWLNSGHVQSEVAHKLNEWFEQGLKKWDISRDEPYFGFEIPGHRGKYFYVWLDAPIGYMAAFEKLCTEKDNLNFDDFWGNSTTELYHFVGKDIIYFHALFWPAMLTSAGFRKPSAIFTHGFLTVDGQKMSKSRGTFIKARTYLNHLDPEYLRYYFAAKLNSRVDDIDLNFADFVQRVNSDLIGKVVNIASRSAGFINKKFDGILADKLDDNNLYKEFIEQADVILDLYEKREFSHAVRNIMLLADKANQYVDNKKPWVLAKEEGKEQEVQDVATMALNLFRVLIIYLKPILPAMSSKVENFLNIEPLDWEDLTKPLLAHKINKFKPLMQRIEQEQVDKIIDESKM